MVDLIYNNSENVESCQDKTREQVLDGLLSKVGYGIFHKKLLVTTHILFLRLANGLHRL